jgi:hypothetical protein
MAHAAALPARGSVPLHRDAFTVAVAAMFFAGGIVFAGLWGTAQLLDGAQIGLASTLTETALALERDASALGADRADDATALRALAVRLRQDGRVLGDHPEWNTTASAASLETKSEQLDADAATLAARGAAIGDPVLVAAADRLRAAARMLSGAADQARGMMRR